MKKLIAILLAAALCLIGFAMAEEVKADEKFNTLIEDGEFIIQVAADGDQAWVADDMSQDDTVVELAYADTLEDTFVARYTPVGDGDVTVAVRHFIGIACDEMMTWDLHVEGGAVTEVLGGSYTLRPDDETIATQVAGSWIEEETQFTRMTIEKNPESGLDVEIVSPMTHGAYLFKTGIDYDCELDAFVYDKGKFWNVPITDSDEEVELGDAAVAGTTGSFSFVDDEGELKLAWYDDSQENTIIFVPYVEEEAEETELTGFVDYVCPDDCGLQFTYDADVLEITYEDYTDDEDMVVLNFTNADWGESFVQIHLAELEDDETFPTEEDLAVIAEGLDTNVEQLETWGGFSNVYTYESTVEDITETVFIAPVYDDDGEVEDCLTVTIVTCPLEDEGDEMARSDAISAVVDTLAVVDD